MKSDHRNTPAALKPRSKHSQALFERAELVIYLHPQRLKHLGSRMMTAVTADQFFDSARQRQIFASLQSGLRCDAPLAPLPVRETTASTVPHCIRLRSWQRSVDRADPCAY